MKGVAYPSINDGNFFEGLFPLPPLAEQKRIVEKCDRLMAQCDKLEQLQREREQKRIVIHTAAREKLLKASDQDTFGQAWDFIKENFGELYAVRENVTSLRQTILQLAVMGKLVPQDPGDRPATELLKEIESEKKRLIKEGKIKKQKPLPEITADKIPYDLPNSWEWVRVVDVVDVGTGSTPTTTNPDYYHGEIPWYTSSATNKFIADKPKTLITQKALNETNCKIFPSGSLIIALYGQGKTRGQISEIIIAGATNQAIAAMVFFDTSRAIKKYIKYYFLKMYEEIRELAEGGAQPNLNVGKIKETLIPLPPLPEQHRIVAKVDALMALCDRLENQIDQQTTKQTQLLESVMAGV
jgi:type I restriction enzyme S subunit